MEDREGDGGRPARGRRLHAAAPLRRAATPVLGVAVAAALVAGCAARRAGEAGSETPPAVERPLGAGPAAAFTWEPDPFPVADSTGSPIQYPFLGGFDVPRPQLVDVDGDGDLDLFLQERSHELMLFERVGGPGPPRFVWRTDRWRDLDIGEWYRFADVDLDGDLDLLTEEPFSLIRYYRNDAGAGRPPSFTLVADTLKAVDGEALYSDRQNIPNVVDLDCDGRIDLMIGRLDGTVTRYEATGNDPTGAPRFELVTDHFEDIRIVTQITPSARHGANTLVFTDVDGDGDQDLFWGDFFEPGLLFLENTGSCAAPRMPGPPVPFPRDHPLETSGYNAPTFGDLDGDGDADLIVGVLGGAYNAAKTAADNLYLLERTGPAGWALRTRRLIGQIDVGSESVPALGDLDGDGDLDLLVANKIDPADQRTARIYLFESVGTPTAPAFRRAGPLDVEGEFHYAPALVDLDGDGDLDLAVGTWNDGVLLYRNDGAGGLVRQDAPLVELTHGSHATPAFGDVDGDGDLDLFAGEASGEVNAWRNDGTPERPAFTLVSDAFEGIDVGRRSAPALADVDGDGDLDLVVGAEDGSVSLWRNEGGWRFVKDPSWQVALPGLATPAFGDLDGDGDPDLVIGNGSGGVRYYENRRGRDGG